MRFLTCVISAGALAICGCGGSSHRFETFTVPSPSMAPTLRIGDGVRVDTAAYAHSHTQRGDIVIVHPPQGAERNVCGVPGSPKDGRPCGLPAGGPSDIELVKRVVAVGGDSVSIDHNRTVIDGHIQDEPFARVSECLPVVCTLPHAVVVPPGDVFVLGDNRAASDDSRSFGPVPEKWVVGQITNVVARGGQPVPQPGG